MRVFWPLEVSEMSDLLNVVFLLAFAVPHCLALGWLVRNSEPTVHRPPWKRWRLPLYASPQVECPKTRSHARKEDTEWMLAA